jgi:hypothetical protein
MISGASSTTWNSAISRHTPRRYFSPAGDDTGG